MKRIAIAIVVLSLLGAGCATPSRPQAGSSPETSLEPYDSVVLTVYGLSCPLCSNNLDGQLRGVSGVKDATIDLKTGAVTVTLIEGHSVTRQALAKAVEDAGFTLKDVQPVRNSS